MSLPRATLLAGSILMTLVARSPADAQEPDPCAPQTYRWLEDCGALADEERHGVNRLRYVPLDDRGAVWATFGMEYRARVETLDAIDFGIGGAPNYVALAHRGLAHIDLRTRSGPRLFLQASIADQSGREPAARPFDESGLDAAQVFVDVPLGALTLRLGRQEFNLGGNRLVALRDGVTLRRAFDAMKVDFAWRGWRAAAFVGRPVSNRPDALDDESDRHDQFGGLTVEAPNGTREGRWSLFYFDRLRAEGRTLQASGKDRRHTLGLRYVASEPKWEVTAQGAVQVGDLAGYDVRAGGLGVEIGWRPDGPTGTRFGASFGVGSGDRDRTDDEINTFDPLYPNLGAFSDAPLWYPSNQIAVGVNAAHTFGAVSLRVESVLLARTSLSDAIYANPGRPLAYPNGVDRLGAWLIQGSARWMIDPHLEIYASLVRAEALDTVEAAGGHSASFGMLQLSARY